MNPQLVSAAHTRSSNNTKQRRSLILAAAAMAGLASTASAVDRTWNGGGDTNNFSNAGNWVGGVAPVANDSVTFDGFGRLTPVNNLTLDIPLNGITFSPTAGAFTVS